MCHFFLHFQTNSVSIKISLAHKHQMLFWSTKKEKEEYLYIILPYQRPKCDFSHLTKTANLGKMSVQLPGAWFFHNQNQHNSRDEQLQASYALSYIGGSPQGSSVCDVLPCLLWDVLKHRQPCCFTKPGPENSRKKSGCRRRQQGPSVTPLPTGSIPGVQCGLIIRIFEYIPICLDIYIYLAKDSLTFSRDEYIRICICDLFILTNIFRYSFVQYLW